MVMSLIAIEHLFTLQRSPFVLAPILHQFYVHAPSRERNILLGYLVLPLVLYPDSGDYLRNVKTKSSTLRTMCSQQKRLVGLAVRVQEFKSLTNATLQVLSAGGVININEDLSVKSIRAVQVDNCNHKYLDSSRKLAGLFTDDVVTIYRTLGLKSI
jgi:hypothetical protein